MIKHNFTGALNIYYEGRCLYCGKHFLASQQEVELTTRFDEHGVYVRCPHCGALLDADRSLYGPRCESTFICQGTDDIHPITHGECVSLGNGVEYRCNDGCMMLLTQQSDKASNNSPIDHVNSCTCNNDVVKCKCAQENPVYKEFINGKIEPVHRSSDIEQINYSCHF